MELGPESVGRLSICENHGGKRATAVISVIALKIAGAKHWLWRAVDQTGIVLDETGTKHGCGSNKGALREQTADRRAAEPLSVRPRQVGHRLPWSPTAQG